MPSQFLKVALEAAKNAEEIITAYYTGDAMKVELKEDETPVTLADRGAEKVIRETIKRAFPNHGFLGEEYGIEEGESPYVWIIDPIDATKNYIRKIPIFGTQIALMKGDDLILGISNAPLLNELLYAEAGNGAFLNGEPIQVSDVAQPEDAMVCHGGLKWFVEKGTFPGVYNLINDVARSRGFGDFYMYHLVASARADIVVEAAISVWDIAAITVIVREAGGKVTDIQGQPITTDTASLVATNGVLHDTVLDYFKDAKS
ncbi:inositol-phosphate phosphatase [Candidatus Poribacteria bacterium]|nr:inositol-phosphate phosphatase [Candidatus Poribacteria bacterium]MYG07868.1 inositol-phosphate phosphatase [Candidatus Poribacteria bacterium]MYK21043.1 inositol-phosphate phosphatase [Candidatus Poribacteria bacterium]